MIEKKYTWHIYKLINPLGQVYIGKTRNIKNRVRQYKYPAHHKHHLASSSVKQYGFENHSFSIIESFEGNDRYANGKEIFWIRTFMCNRNQWPEMNGLNLTKGGQGNLGRPSSEKQKLAVSIAHKGHTRNRGKKYSSEVREKISKAQTGRKLTGRWLENVSKNNKLRQSRRIVNITKDGQCICEYESITIAAKKLNISRHSIGRVLNGSILNAKGLYFKYID